MTKKPTTKTAEKKEEDVQKVAIVEDTSATGGPAGPAMTDRQRAGLDPLDPALDAEQAADREHLTNMQTDHEAENVLDPVSGDPNPGVTEDAPLTAKATGAPVSDMSGRPAMPSPLAGTDGGETGKAGKSKKDKMTDADRAHVSNVRQKLTEARQADRDNDVDESQAGYRAPLEIGVPGATLRRMEESGSYPIEGVDVPGGIFFPETGRRYRIK